MLFEIRNPPEIPCITRSYLLNLKQDPLMRVVDLHCRIDECRLRLSQFGHLYRHRSDLGQSVINDESGKWRLLCLHL